MLKKVADYFSSSLAASTLLQFSIRITLVVVVVSALSYWHIFKNLEERTYDGLKNYITERGVKESEIFTLAEDNHATAKSVFVEYWERSNTKEDLGFHRLFEAFPDGTHRIPQRNFDGIDRGDGSRSHSISGFVGPNAPVGELEFQNRLAMAYWVISRFAEGWGNRFPNFYVTMPENVVIGYWPGLPWGLQADPKFDITKEEWYTVANPDQLKGKPSAWTGSYYDQTVNEWMVSCITPVDINGRRVLNFGHDILLNRLFERTINEKLEGTYNFIVRKDGRLIAHPQQTEALKKSAGQLYVKDTGDKVLINMANLVLAYPLESAQRAALLDDKTGNNILAFAPLGDLDWYFVTVYPKSLLSSIALETVRTILFLGLVSVVLEMLMLYLVFRKNVLEPFRVFSNASEEVARGNYKLADLQGLPAMIAYKNEVGRLARTLKHMAAEIQAYSVEMEQKVNERTAELINTQKELVLKQKMAALGVLTAGVAHEINNPNNAISGGAQAVMAWRQNFDAFLQELMSADADPEIKEAFEARFKKLDSQVSLIDTGSRRIKSIVDGLRTLTRVDEGARIEVDMLSGLDHYVRILQPNIEGSIRVFTDFQSRPRALCWAAELNQAYMNIITNACHAIELKQSQSSEGFAGEINIKSSVIGDKLHILVADNGVGMAPEVLEKAMDPFFTTKTVGTGAGLGLSISRDIIKKHGGTLEIQSTLGEGTTVHIVLPLVTVNP